MWREYNPITRQYTWVKVTNNRVFAALQKCLLDFLWSGQHWLKASVLYLPIQEGGQGLVDIRSRVKAFRLQTVKGLLYGEDVSWAEVACNLLRKAGNMGLDRHLFLMDINRMDLSRRFLQVNFNSLDSLQSFTRTEWGAENVAEGRTDSFQSCIGFERLKVTISEKDSKDCKAFKSWTVLIGGRMDICRRFGQKTGYKINSARPDHTDSAK